MFLGRSPTWSAAGAAISSFSLNDLNSSVAAKLGALLGAVEADLARQPVGVDPGVELHVLELGSWPLTCSCVFCGSSRTAASTGNVPE